MKKSLSFALALTLSLSLVLAACSPAAEVPNTTPTPTPTVSFTPKPTPADDTVTFTDSAGRAVEIPADISRIAPSGLLAQMVLFALAPEKLVCIATAWPEETEQFIDAAYYNLPVLGQVYGSGSSELNTEALAATHPQLIIDVGEPEETVVEDMDSITDQTGIPTLHIDAATATMGETYRTLGKLLGLEERAEELASYCDEVYAKTLALMDKVGSGKVSLLYCTGDNGLSVIAQGSYHAEVLDLMSDNLAVLDAPTDKDTGNEVTLEQILFWNPDVILFAPGSIYTTIKSNPAWQELTAIQTHRYYQVPFGPYNWLGFPPSVNRYMGMLWLGTLLYPDDVDYDLYTEAARYYKLFYHTDLTYAQYSALIDDSIGQ